MKICIDDERDVAIADETYRTAAEGLYRLVEIFFHGETIDVLYLDFDLGEGGDTSLISTFIGFAASAGKNFITEVVVHSMNAPAAAAIMQHLRSCNVNVQRGTF